MDQILEKLLARPSLQTAQMAGAAVRSPFPIDVEDATVRAQQLESAKRSKARTRGERERLKE